MNFSLFRNHFQVAYVVHDMDAAIRRFTNEFGMPNWSVMLRPSATGKGGAMRKFAGCYSGDLMFELIEPDLDCPSIFRDFLPATRDGFRLHHLGYMIHNAEDYSADIARLDEAGFARAHGGSFGEVLDFHIADTTAIFGHYVELIFAKSQGDAFFNKMPRN